MAEKPKTPNLDKLIDNTTTYNTIAQFLEWLSYESDYHIAEYGEESATQAYARLWHSKKSVDEILHEYLELDPKVIEAERQAILDYISEAYKEKTPPAVTMAVTIGDEKEVL